jgi:thiosulfate reductase cytochrome b subunit
MRREYVYKGFERFWHWTQAGLILFLALTGFEIHGSLRFFGFEQAVRYHSAAAMALLVLIAFAIFWHLTTGEWRQYVPTLRNIRAQAEYYVVGIFRGTPHPTRKTALSKLNPLQRLVYLGLKLLVIPVIVTSGLLYMFYRYPQSRGIDALNVSGLYGIAVVHTAGAFLLVAFLIGHLYLITTGTTATSNLKAMITGWEELQEAQPVPGPPTAVPNAQPEVTP